MYDTILSFCLGMLGITGTIILATTAGTIFWRYRDIRPWSYRWHYRNGRLKQLSAIACLFFLAMTASYGVLGEVWTWIYFLAAFKTGTWWLRCYISGRA
ncbi:MAG TPA: hypothetical protein VNG51_26430 [Ktedonobacteraceae bacterium]|nr:hypothetical protein [Ktedonobacteraceae bacterium]